MKMRGSEAKVGDETLDFMMIEQRNLKAAVDFHEKEMKGRHPWKLVLPLAAVVFPPDSDSELGKRTLTTSLLQTTCR